MQEFLENLGFWSRLLVVGPGTIGFIFRRNRRIERIVVDLEQEFGIMRRVERRRRRKGGRGNRYGIGKTSR